MWFRKLNCYLISKETEPLQEVLRKLEFVFHRVFLHLCSHLLGLLTHAVLQEEM